MLHAEFTNIAVEPYDPGVYSDLAAKLSVTAQQLPKSSPEWVPDHFATECMLCRAEFTFTFRRWWGTVGRSDPLTYTRHHCRRCGLCVCRNCAPKENARPILEWNIQQPVRHCKRCFRWLTRALWPLLLFYATGLPLSIGKNWKISRRRTVENYYAGSSIDRRQVDKCVDMSQCLCLTQIYV